MKALTGLSFQRKDGENSPRMTRPIVPVSIWNISVASNDPISTSPSSPELSDKKDVYYSLSDIHSHKQRDVEVPDEIVASYVNDFNLLRIHETIIRKLKAERGKIDGLKKELDKYIEIIKTPQTIIERKQTKKRIRSIEAQIVAIKDGTNIKLYLEKAEPLIEEYKTMIPKKRQIDFTATEKKKQEILEEEEKDPKYWKKMRLIRKYLDFAQNYINITIIQKKKNTNRCGCGYDLTNVFIDNFGTQVCPKCKTERYIIGFNLYKSDTLASRNDYSDRDNFEKALMRYQGKQIDKIPDSLFTDLDAHFIARGKSTSVDIAKLPRNKRGRKNGTDLPMLYKALLDTGYSSLYEDANLIAHRYWGWKLPDVSHLEALIMEDYEKTQRVYNMLPKERSSSLGTQFRLFKHLELRGHTCTVSDFKIVKMRESLEYHDQTWRIMCEECGDPEIYFIPTI